MENFGDWLREELKDRGMSQKDLAVRSGITPAQISRIISGSRGAGEESLSAIARALKLPLETVFRAAGILPKRNAISEKREEAYHVINGFPEHDLDTVIAVLRALEAQKQQQGPTSAKPTTHKSRKQNPARSVLNDK
jgi:transcriptional regulator with XRE-family HTH domain